MRIITKTKLLFVTFLISVTASSWAAPKKSNYEELIKEGSGPDIVTAFKKDNLMKNAVIGDEKDTLLMAAIKYQRPETIVNLILKGGVDVNAKNKNKQNALMYTCIYSKDAGVIKLILKKIGNNKKIQKALNEKDKNGFIAFRLASENDNTFAIDVINSYLNSDSSEDNRNKNDVIVIEKDPEQEPEQEAPAVEEEKTEQVEEPAAEPQVNVAVDEPAVVEEKTEEAVEETAASSEAILPEDSPSVNKYDKTYLYDYVVMEEDPEPEEEPETEALAFIENPDKKDKNGRTALMLACKAGNDWEIKSLLHSHADINLSDKDGWTALMYAARYQNNMEIINLLINNGADVSVKNKFGATPLQLAATYTNNPDILKKLINTATPNSEELFRAFILAISSSNSNAVTQITKLRVFLDRGIAINRFYEGKTPLMYAAEYSSSTSVIKLLLDNGAVSGIRTAEGKTAFNFAESNKHLEHNDVYWSLNGK